MIRMIIILFFLIFNSCGNTQLLSVDESAVKNDSPIIATGNDDESQSHIMAKNYGAKGDALQLSDFTLNGDILSSPTVSFTRLDIGKSVSIAFAGKNAEHLVSTITSIIDNNKVKIADKAYKDVVNVQGSYGTDNIVHLQKAIDAAIKLDKVLFVDKGVYLIGDRNPITGNTSLRITMNRPNQSFKLMGAGKNKTIFREIDGKTQRLGRYTKIFYHYLNNSNNINSIELSDFALDKNGRSLSKNPSTPYAWEQAHGWSWAASKSGPNLINKIVIRNIEIIDKIGAGINFSSSNVLVNDVVIQNITERNFNGSTKGAINYGQRGDLEISCFSPSIIMKELDLRYIQIEPVRSMSAIRGRERHVTIKNSIIQTLDYTESDNGNPLYSSLTVDSLVSSNFLVRSIRFSVNNSTLSVKNLINSVDGSFKNCNFLLFYDSETNKVKPINNSYLKTLGNIKNNTTYDNCSFIIDDSNPSIKPIGNAFTASSKVTSLDNNTIIIQNCTFDERLESIVNAYGNGSWTFINNKLSGRDKIIIGGSYGVYTSQITLENNTITNNSQGEIFVNNNNDLWTIDLSQENEEITQRLRLKKPKSFKKNQIIK